MQSTDRVRRHRKQRGQTIIEPLVASLLLGIAMVAGLTALQAATAGAHAGVNNSWGHCAARGEAGLVTAAAWSDNGYLAPPNVTAVVDWSGGSGAQRLQRVKVAAVDPDPPHRVLIAFSVYKSLVLAGPNIASTADAAAIATSCAGMLGRT